MVLLPLPGRPRISTSWAHTGAGAAGISLRFADVSRSGWCERRSVGRELCLKFIWGPFTSGLMTKGHAAARTQLHSTKMVGSGKWAPDSAETAAGLAGNAGFTCNAHLKKWRPAWEAKGRHGGVAYSGDEPCVIASPHRADANLSATRCPAFLKILLALTRSSYRGAMSAQGHRPGPGIACCRVPAIYQ